MKLVRPYVPLDVRLQVIAWQMQADGKIAGVLATCMRPSTKALLDFMLQTMFGDQKVHLDHDPPLCLREVIDAEKGIYVPDANDPRYLVYRTEQDHKIKTFVRGDGAQLSDAGKRRKEIKRQRKLEPSRKRSWPAGRKLRSRPMGASR